MGLVMLFPKHPLLPRVLITACDVFFALLVGDPLRRQLVKLFESSSLLWCAYDRAIHS